MTNKKQHTAKVLAVESPRSFWQCVEMMTFSTPGVLTLISAINFPNSSGKVIPTVSGMFKVVAPAFITSPRMSTPSLANCRAMSSFSLEVMVAPGDCSPSLRVASNMRTWLGSEMRLGT